MSERRVALLIGNGDYKDAPLKNPVNDARDMHAALKALDFDATLLLDATMQQMERAVREFGSKLRQGGTGLFYYAGHGLQLEGNNYLIPVSAVIESKSDVRFGCLDAGLVLGKMEDADNGLNIIILDACRENPFRSILRGPERGLAKMDAPTGSLIAYACAPGTSANDGEGKNGLYTQHLLQNIGTPGMIVEEMFKRVRQGVAKDSAKKQVPWEESSLIGHFSFVAEKPGEKEEPPSAPPLPSPPPPPEPTSALSPDPLPPPLPPSSSPASPTPAASISARPSFPSWLRKARYGAVVLALMISAFVAYFRPGGGTNPEPKRESPSGASNVASPAPAAAPATGAVAPAVGTVWRDPVTGMEFVWVPQGCFMMGSPSSETGHNDDEGPVHEVCISGLWVGKYAVTNEEYRKYKPGHGSSDYKNWSLNEDRKPAVYVSWEDAKAYAQWLSGQGNGKFRLLTEAEWEYAARARTTTSRFWGDSPDDACRYANVHDRRSRRTFSELTWEAHDCDDRYAVTAPVGRFRPNAFGLYDMLGNVWQWCEDVYDAKAYSSHSRDNPLKSGSGSDRVLRGGSWRSSPWYVRSSIRESSTPDARLSNYGFRLVREP